MTIDRQIELLKIERECVQRNHDGRCNRDCANCELVQIDTELLEMYDEVIKNYEMAAETMIQEDQKKAEQKEACKKAVKSLCDFIKKHQETILKAMENRWQ